VPGHLLRIGAVAARAGISVDTIRYYERLGLLPRPQRTPAGYREYPDTIVNRIQVVRNAQRFGFSLREVAGFLRTREAGGTPCHQVRVAAQKVLDAVDEQIVELTVARATMTNTLREWDRRLARTPKDAPARLLEALSDNGPPARPGASSRPRWRGTRR
jgi:DNA-binding transcriptional MerR regulator